MLPNAVLHHFERRMIAALPMHLEQQLTKRHSDDDLFKNRSQYPLSYRNGGCRLVPQARNICP
jgi:hypothetical protein